MTAHRGAVVFVEVAGELADESVVAATIQASKPTMARWSGQIGAGRRTTSWLRPAFAVARERGQSETRLVAADARRAPRRATQGKVDRAVASERAARRGVSPDFLSLAADVRTERSRSCAQYRDQFFFAAGTGSVFEPNRSRISSS